MRERCLSFWMFAHFRAGATGGLMANTDCPIDVVGTERPLRPAAGAGAAEAIACGETCCRDSLCSCCTVLGGTGTTAKRAGAPVGMTPWAHLCCCCIVATGGGAFPIGMFAMLPLGVFPAGKMKGSCAAEMFTSLPCAPASTRASIEIWPFVSKSFIPKPMLSHRDCDSEDKDELWSSVFVWVWRACCPADRGGMKQHNFLESRHSCAFVRT